MSPFLHSTVTIVPSPACRGLTYNSQQLTRQSALENACRSVFVTRPFFACTDHREHAEIPPEDDALESGAAMRDHGTFFFSLASVETH